MAAKDQNKPQKVPPVVIDGFEINAQNVNYQKLQEFSLKLYEKLLYQRKERNHLLLERDKLRTILENYRFDINVARNTALNKEEELERLEEKNRKEIMEIDQEVKYIIYDHNINLTELKEWENSFMAKIVERNSVEELQLLKEKRELKEKLEDIRKKHEEELANMKTQHLKEILDLKDERDKEQMEIEIKFKRNLSSSLEQSFLKHEMEMSELEERKNIHFIELKAIHKNRLDEMKEFFNNITAENLTAINNLKQFMKAMKQNKSSIMCKVKKLQQENNKLQEPLDKSQGEVKNLKRQLINYEKDLLSLKINKKKLLEISEEIAKSKKNSTALKRKLKCEDRNEFLNYLDASCLSSLTDPDMNEAGRRNHLIGLVKSLIEELVRKYKRVERLSIGDPNMRKALGSINFEYWNPKQLSYELSVACKCHNELVLTLGKKLEEFCIETDKELGQKHSGIKTLGRGPASLISKQF